jgi:hypothetical protein
MLWPNTSMIMGRDGRLIWDNFPMALKYWRIEWDKPDGGKESWHGKAIISQTDLRAMMEERAKSSPIPMNEPISQSFIKVKRSIVGGSLFPHFQTLSTLIR